MPAVWWEPNVSEEIIVSVFRVEIINEPRNQQKLSLPSYSAGFSFTLLFDLEDGGDVSLLNLKLCPNYTALQIGRSYS
jgi:hypothetical protein